MITLTPLQYQLFVLTIGQITESLARLQLVKDFTDEQCQVLIDKAVQTTEELDRRREEH